MKKLIALLLALSMVFALAGCGYKSVAGKWKATVDLADSARDSMGDKAEIFRGVNVVFILEMKEDQTFTLTMDYSGVAPLLKEKLRDYIAESLGLQGKAKELYESAYEKLLSEKVESYLQQLSTPTTGTYTDEEGKLTLKPKLGIAMTGSWSGRNLSLNGTRGSIEFSRSK